MFTLQGMKDGESAGDATTCAIQDLVSSVNDLLLNQGCEAVLVVLAQPADKPADDPAA